MFIINCTGISKPVFPTVFQYKRDALIYIKRVLVDGGFLKTRTADLDDREFELLLRAVIEARNVMRHHDDGMHFHIRDLSKTRKVCYDTDIEDRGCEKSEDMLSDSSSDGVSVEDTQEESEAEPEAEEEAEDKSVESLTEGVARPMTAARGKRGRPTTGQLTTKKAKKA